MRRRKTAWILPRATLLVLALTTAGLAQVEESLDSALQSFRQGNYDQAYTQLESLFQEAPTNDAILDLLDRSRLNAIVKMVASEDPRLSGAGIRLLELRRSAVQKKISDPATINAKLDAYFAAEPQERLALKTEIAATMGRNAALQVLERLGADNPSVRALAELLIVEIGIDAAPVLIAAADHPKATLRVGVARLLGTRNLRHPVVAATLADLAANDSESVVQEAAERSLNALLQEYGVAKNPPFEYYYNNARRFYLLPHSNPFDNPYYTPAVFHVRDGAVVAEEVAEFQVSDRMAEQALHKALELRPDNLDVLAMLVCNDASQLIEYDAALEGVSASNAELTSLLESQASQMRFVRGPRLLAAPSPVLFEALGLSLDDEHNLVATKVLEVIDQTGRRGTLPASLVRAVNDNPSRTVRVHAAVVLSKWDPAALSTRIGESIVDVLAEAVVNSGLRTAQTVFGNPDRRNRFDALFRELSVESYAHTSDVESAIIRATELPPDMLIIGDEARVAAGRDGVAPINLFVRQIRGHHRTADVPIVVVVPRARLEQARNIYGDEGNQVVVISDEADRVAFRTSVIDPFFKDRDDAKARALRGAIQAAEALEHLAASHSPLPVAASVERLTSVLRGRPDAVRVPCLSALGKLREAASDSVEEIASVFAATDNSTQVRAAAMYAVARILDATDGRASAAVVKIITDGMQSDQLALRESSYAAFAAAGVTGEDRLAALFGVSAPEGGAPASTGASGAGDAAPDLDLDLDLDAEEPSEEPEPELDLDLDLDGL